MANADTTAPVLTGLSFPWTINLSGGNAPTTFSAMATDDSSGVKEVIVWFDRPFSTDIGSFPLVGLYGFSDSWSDGSSSDTRTVLSTNPGTYSVTRVTVEDFQGNQNTYTPSQLAALGAPTSLTLSGSQRRYDRACTDRPELSFDD